MARLQGIGRVADDRQHALVADRTQPVFVGRFADQRLGIELPVAGMQHRADGGADHHRVRLGDRMGQRDQFEVERADREAAGHRHGVDRDLVGELGLDQLGAQ